MEDRGRISACGLSVFGGLPVFGTEPVVDALSFDGLPRLLGTGCVGCVGSWIESVVGGEVCSEG